MSCCGKLGEALKKIFNALKPLLAVALLCVSAYFLFLAPAGATVGSVFGGLSWMPTAITTSAISASTAGYLALGAAVLVDSEGVSQLAGTVASSVGKVAGTVVAAAAGGLVSGLSGGNALLWIIGGLALYFLLTSDDDERKEDDVRDVDVKEGDLEREVPAPRVSGHAPVPLNAGGLSYAG